ncbi:MAG TPA: serine/threonine-protein kinase [Candidatus Dormibacteraeota bacterium]|nr:serine/threonine-protein kinase [Candidatus Dormibacteraeota bacterium]
MKLAPGVQIGPYQVVEQIGRGGMATVFKAYQPALERMVALKVLPEVLAEDPQFRERFRREAVAIAKLRHPSILAVYDHGEFEDQLYIVTEFVEGGTLAAELGKPLGVQRTVEVLGAIASALDYAHRQGVLHRDVKPSNILINKEGAAILGDFGLARMMAPTGERLTRIDMVVGTPEYMSPEQCAGKDASPASDQYSLGVVAFEALTGHVPYEAETPAAVMLEQIQSPLPMPRSVNQNLSEGVEQALLRALAKDPAQRFATCGELVKAIETETETAPVIAAPTMPHRVQRPTPFTRRFLTPWQTAAALALVVVLATVSVALYLSGAHPGGTTSNGRSGAEPAHGSLIYNLKLNSTAWSGGTEPSPDPAQSMSIAYPGGSIDFHILKSGAGISAGFDGPSLKNYVADFVLKADTGSDFALNWQLIGAGNNEQAEVDLHIDITGETMTLVLSPYSGNDQEMTASIPVPGLQHATTADIAAVVTSGTVTLYLNGKKVGEGSETKATGPASPGFYMNGASGTLHVLSLRYYALP